MTFKVPLMLSGESLSINLGSTINSSSSTIAKCLIIRPSLLANSIVCGVILEIPLIFTSLIVFVQPSNLFANITNFPAASKPSISRVGSVSAIPNS